LPLPSLSLILILLFSLLSWVSFTKNHNAQCRLPFLFKHHGHSTNTNVIVSIVIAIVLVLVGLWLLAIGFVVSVCVCVCVWALSVACCLLAFGLSLFMLLFLKNTFQVAASIPDPQKSSFGAQCQQPHSQPNLKYQAPSAQYPYLRRGERASCLSKSSGPPSVESLDGWWAFENVTGPSSFTISTVGSW
jgi:hypothetical protein